MNSICSIASISPKNRKFVILDVDDYKKWVDTHRKEKSHFESHPIFDE